GAGGAVLTFDGSSSGGAGVVKFDGPGGASGGAVYNLTARVPSHADCSLCNPSAASGTNTAAIEITLPPESVAATYSATAACLNAPAACWIVVPTPSGAIAAHSGAAITAIVDPHGLNPGLYSANVAVTIAPAGAKSGTLNVPVTILVTPAEPALTLSQTGLQFQTVSGAGGPATQSISILNTGTGSLSVSANAVTAGGGNWLSVSPASGAATASTLAQAQIQVNPSGLAPGLYSGRVDFAAPSALNSPQSAEVALTVLPSTAAPGPVISPAALVFAVPGGGNPAPQTVQIANPSGKSLTVSNKLSFAQGNGWFTVSAGGTVTSAQPLTETISVNPAGLAPGVYLGTLDLHIAETNTDNAVTVMLVAPKSAGSCTPTQLLPVFTNLAGAFQATAGLPMPLQAQVVDDCGKALNSGSVTAYFGGTDTPVALAPLGNGQWSGTWMPHGIAAGPTWAGVIATSFTPALYGSGGVTGSLADSPNAPLVSAGGLVNAASLVASEPLAPGSYISIFGSNLADGATPAGALPFPQNLGGTEVLLGGELLPLEYAGADQINAIVPYDVAVNTFQQLIVERDGVYAPLETVLLAPAQPAVFTQDQSGKGAGAIMVVRADGTQFLNTAASPAGAGDALVIYCTGLGAVTPADSAGSAAPDSPLASTSNPVTVTIGGTAVQAFFAGLTPGYAGLYQVNVIVPPGIPAGSSVPVVVSAAGASSPAVTVALQ
ncbi:MAG: hypothetical protein ABI165_05895, partial [Bryobacteraceae bacterium]